jgi:hypothetical protein
MPHLVLLGDSIFANAAYTSGGPDVISQVRSFLPTGWQATLVAIDGSTTDCMPDQIARLPKHATHLVLSVGGNNALMNASDLGIPLFGYTTGDTTIPRLVVMDRLADIAENFHARYRKAVEACLGPGLPLAVCTIYNGCFPDPKYQRAASVALAIFNDVILRVAIEHNLPVIDLRLICTHPDDYANPIEPSSKGGEKIARVIVALVTRPDSFAHATRIVGASTSSK